MIGMMAFVVTTIPSISHAAMSHDGGSTAAVKSEQASAPTHEDCAGHGGQKQDVQKTAELSLSLRPDRVAVFGYAHVPWMKKHMRLIHDDELPSADARLDQFARAEAVLTAQGMKPIGLDHFVTEDDDMYRFFAARRLTRNFQGYTTDTAKTMLGLGVSSIGLSDTGFFQNAANITEYAEAVNKGALPTKRGYVLTDEDRVRAHIISDLMCYLAVDVESVLGAHNRPADSFDSVLAQLPELAADSILTVQGRTVTVNPDARQAVRVVCALFDAHFAEGAKKHAQAA